MFAWSAPAIAEDGPGICPPNGAAAGVHIGVGAIIVLAGNAPAVTEDEPAGCPLSAKGGGGGIVVFAAIVSFENAAEDEAHELPGSCPPNATTDAIVDAFETTAL